MKRIIFPLLLFLTSCSAYKIGAILREREDAHIAAAIQYTVEWLNQRGIYGNMEYLIEYIDVLDHYAAIKKTCSMVEKDRVIAIVGGSHALLNAQIERLVDQLDIPLLTSVDDLGHAFSSPFRVDFFPRAQLFEAVVDLFRHWKWNRITIVYEEDARIRRLEPLLESDQYSSIRFQLIKVQNGNYMKAASEVKELEECRYQAKKDCSEFSRVLLDLNPKHTYNFLLAALQMGLIELKHWFLLTNMELSTMSMELFRYNHARYISPYPVDSNFLTENRNVFDFAQFTKHVRTKWNAKTGNSRNLRMMEAVFTFDAIYTFANAFTDSAARQQMDDTPQTTCRKPSRGVRKYQHGRTLVEALNHNNLRGLTGDLRRLNGDPKASNYSMRIHLLGYSGKLDNIGFWEPATDVHVNMSGDSRAQLQKNVQVSDELKPHFRVTTIMERPYVMLKKNHYELEGNAKFEGFCIDLLSELSKDLGFTYTIHAVKDGKYGNDKYGNGSWDGMIGEILRGFYQEAEMLVAPFTVNFRRSEVVDFTKPFLSLGISILYKVPDDHQPDLFSFLNPFSWQVWLAILTSIDNTTLHGPKRIYHGKGWSMAFWIFMTLFSLVFLVYQVTVLGMMYFSTPTVSQVAFLIDENGLDFPMVTLCNFNPIKKTYIKAMNKTGDFSDNLLDYLMQSNEDVQVLYGNADRAELHLGDADLNVYKQKHANFSIDGFFLDSGFECGEMMKMCSFGGRQFDCCKYMRPVLTNLGKCYTLDMPGSDRDWLHRQTTAGVNAGLQLILDTHLEEQFDGTGDDAEPIFSNAFENGFRYYVHASNTIPYLVSEGISVSPSTRVYSAITTNTYNLLSSDHWGNCSEKWPEGYSTSLPYTAANRQSLCKAAYFNKNCGCSPFTYNIDQSYPVCTPYQTIQCIDKYIRVVVNGTDYFKMPMCTECKIECKSLVYHAYNSYGHGFSNGALKWLNKKNPTWSIPHVKANFLTINVFFRDMGHTEYTQVQATSLTETLSDIGGNMGMFLGMSLITFLEVSLYLSKVSWIVISKKRRDYLFEKKKKEEEREKQLEETVSGFKFFRTRKEGSGSFRNTRKKISELRRHISDSISEHKRSATVGPADCGRESVDSNTEREHQMNKQRDLFMRNGRKASLYANGEPRQESVIQLRIDVDDLRRKLAGEDTPVNVTGVARRRASTVPAVSDNTFYLWQPPETSNIITE